MAGNIVFRALASQPQEIPKIVIWAGAVYSYDDFYEIGISDPSYQPPPEDSERRQEREELLATHGEYDPASPFWQMVPGTNYLEEMEGTIQVHHAQNDAVVPIDYSRNLMAILDNTDIPHELYEYPTGGHNIEGAAFNDAMERTAAFLREY
jgi:dipeptidyl aminopeptidase/acylaminoacyl peptidase